MARMRSLVRQPAGVVVLLALFAVTAHAASITLFTSRDAFLEGTPPNFAANFNNQPDGVPDVPGQLALEGLTVIGDFRISGGAINFTSPPSATSIPLAYNFGGNTAFEFGEDIVALSRAGTLNFSFDGLSAIFNITSPGFVGFKTNIPFSAINATFTPFPDRGSAFNFVIDSVLVNTVRSVPEPSTLVLIGVGAAVVLVRVYARRRRSAHGDDAQQGDAADRM